MRQEKVAGSLKGHSMGLTHQSQGLSTSQRVKAAVKC